MRMNYLSTTRSIRAGRGQKLSGRKRHCTKSPLRWETRSSGPGHPAAGGTLLWSGLLRAVAVKGFGWMFLLTDELAETDHDGSKDGGEATGGHSGRPARRKAAT